MLIDENQYMSDRMSQSSIESTMQYSDTKLSTSDYKFRLSAVITSLGNFYLKFWVFLTFQKLNLIAKKGRCNELKSTYAIYIIDVTKIYPDNSRTNEYWQTYRRFNDFYDLHLNIKKKVCELSNLVNVLKIIYQLQMFLFQSLPTWAALPFRVLVSAIVFPMSFLKNEKANWIDICK